MSRSILERLAMIEWGPGRFFRLDGVQFAREDFDDFYEGDDAMPVMKSRAGLEGYGQTLAGLQVRNMVELGIHRGGSAALFALLLEPERLVTIDIAKPAKRLERFRAENPQGSRIAAFYRTSQDDQAALGEILARETEGPLDLVIDDASHFYDQTRASFEILFPRLRPGGLYVIEDWQWAHSRGFAEWRDQPALSNLIFQLMMVAAGRPELIARITVLQSAAIVLKGAAEPSHERIDLEKLYWTQGRPFTLL